jgi:hypothetical protein
MSITCNFSELDPATHKYLVAVRESKGQGAPGIFVATLDSVPTFGCIAAPIVIALILGITLFTDVILFDPVKVALFQAAGCLVGGWLFLTVFRFGGKSNTIAGSWIYVDPLFLYQAHRERITITPVDEVIEARVQANYNNQTYTSSTVDILFPGKRWVSLTVADETRAEEIRVYLNYLAWARSPEGGTRAEFPAAKLGGIAKYVSENGDEPASATNESDSDSLGLDITEVPTRPERARRSLPVVLPLLFVGLFAAGCFYVLGYVINPRLRDHKIYEMVTEEPYVEPRNLRAYLVDGRNQLHREEVTNKLSQFYDKPIAHVRDNGSDPQLREGMAQMLISVRKVATPVVSVQVTETGTPPGQESGKADREKNVRTQLVTAINAEFSKQEWGKPISVPEGPPLPPKGEQYLAYIEKPSEAPRAHFEIEYAVALIAEDGRYQITVTVTLRTDIKQEPVATGKLLLKDRFNPENLSDYTSKVAAEVAKAMVGDTNPPQVGGGLQQIPGF